ncbi:MAG: hypothetical protein C0614_13155 [Desulfuromonas sp.]|nr:MAG: hypothetical protein C0614_13155 [Desulfuromonas sp.]
MIAKINGSLMAYEEVGQGPAVLLLHDLPLNRQMWRPQLNALAAQGFRVIAPDLLGLIENGRNVLNLRHYTACIIALMRYLGVGRAVMVGAGVANELILEILRKHPRRIAGISLFSPSHLPCAADNLLQCEDLAELVREGCRTTATDILCERMLSDCRSLHSRQLTLQVQSWINEIDKELLAKVLLVSGGTPWPETLKVPMQIIQGSRACGQGAEAVSLPTTAHLDIISGAGHLANLEQPERVNRCLLDFLSWLNLVKPRHGHQALAA